MGGLSLGWLGLAPKKWNKAASNFLTGTPEKHENVSTLRPEQEGLYNQLVQSGMQPGAGGAFGDAADYYRGLLGDNSADFEAFAAPQMRQYNEDIIPGISEQFAGMGSGGLSSSGFRNAQVQGGVDLAERLGSLRAQLRQAGAAGLQGIGQAGLQNFSQDRMTQQGSPGLLGQLAPAIGTAAGAFMGGPAGAAAGNQAGSFLGNLFGGNKMVGAQTGPYGGGRPPIPASPPMNNNFNLPNFMQR